jgi:hypothetical protein
MYLYIDEVVVKNNQLYDILSITKLYVELASYYA